jgi:hypothetical protein
MLTLKAANYLRNYLSTEEQVKFSRGHFMNSIKQVTVLSRHPVPTSVRSPVILISASSGPLPPLKRRQPTISFKIFTYHS